MKKLLRGDGPGSERRVAMSRMIRFRDLVKQNNSFKSCPNCGEVEVMQGLYGWDGLIAADPECQNCKFRFVEQKSRWFRRTFMVMSPDEHDQMVRDSLERHATARAAQ
jgi:predicted RNA-binding Zn-ribbon protein involved in translation (DUF1610 family)